MRRGRRHRESVADGWPLADLWSILSAIFLAMAAVAEVGVISVAAPAPVERGGAGAAGGPAMLEVYLVDDTIRWASIQGARCEPAELTRRLTAALGETPGAGVVICHDDRTRSGVVQDVLEAIRDVDPRPEEILIASYQLDARPIVDFHDPDHGGPDR